MGQDFVQVPVAAGTGEGTALLPVGLLAGFLPVYLNQKGGRRTVFVQRPPFGWDGFIIIFTGKASAPTGLSCCAD